MRIITAALLALLVGLSALGFAPPVAGEEAPIMGPIHLNLKESDVFSPETVGDHAQEAIREKPPRAYTSQPGDITRTKDWTTIGTWTAEGIQHDLNLGGNVNFNIWWVEDDTSGYDANLDYRWTMRIGGQQVAYLEDTQEYQCKGDPCNWEGSTSLDADTAVRDDIFEITIEYRAHEDIYIYYDNISFDSGVAFDADAVSFQRGASSGGQTVLEFTEAWQTDARESLKGDYLTLTVAEQLADNGQAQVSNGDAYQVNNVSVTAQKVTWKVSGGDPTVQFSYAANASSYTSPIAVLVSSLPGYPGGAGGDDDDGFLGLPGFELLLALPAVLFVAAWRRRR